MKLVNGSALVAALMVAGLAFAPATAMAEEPADAVQADEASAQELETLNRARIERAQADAARIAAEAVMSATKLDLDIRLIGPTSIAGDL
jgi:hypothetical protein